MDQLAEFIVEQEQSIVDRVLIYAKDRGYYKYTSQDRQAWELAIRGLSNSLIDQCSQCSDIPELGPDEDYRSGAAGDFAILEARMHSKRGVTLPMFLGLMKYNRQAFQDALTDSDFPKAKRIFYHRYLDKFFDRVELGFISAWTASPDFIREILPEDSLKNS
jgi:diguanylate cyclase